MLNAKVPSILENINIPTPRNNTNLIIVFDKNESNKIIIPFKTKSSFVGETFETPLGKQKPIPFVVGSKQQIVIPLKDIILSLKEKNKIIKSLDFWNNDMTSEERKSILDLIVENVIRLTKPLWLGSCGPSFSDGMKEKGINMALTQNIKNLPKEAQPSASLLQATCNTSLGGKYLPIAKWTALIGSNSAHLEALIEIVTNILKDQPRESKNSRSRPGTGQGSRQLRSRPGTGLMPGFSSPTVTPESLASSVRPGTGDTEYFTPGSRPATGPGSRPSTGTKKNTPQSRKGGTRKK